MLQPQVRGLNQVISTSPSKDDAKGLMHQVVAELDASRAEVTRAQESMVTKGVHGSLASLALKIRREHLHIKEIAYDSPKVVHAYGLL